MLVRSLLLYRLSYKVRREQVVEIYDVNVTAMNIYKSKEGLRVFANVGRVAPEGRGFNSHPGQSFSLSLCGPISISRANAHMVYVGR